jgi:hypothetical protein
MPPSATVAPSIPSATLEFIPLRRLPDWLEERGARRSSIPTVHRWASKGVGGCKLGTIRIGGVLHTTPALVGKFIEATSVARRADEGAA